MSIVEAMLPPGFRFHPTDEELVNHYLLRRCAGIPIAVPIIAELDLYKFEPWKLPGMALYGENEWYFFSPRDRKYPNGTRPNRAAGAGYWKATGADKPIGSPKAVAIKKALVFYAGKAPKGEKTNWIMHEYRLAGVDRSARKKNNNSLRLDDWVLCRLYNKRGAAETGVSPDRRSAANKVARLHLFNTESPSHVQPPRTQMLCFESSESSLQLHGGDSSCGSEHMLSPEVITGDKEAVSQLRLWVDHWDYELDFAMTDEIAAVDPFPPFSPEFPDSLMDAFVYLQKPF